MSIFVYNGINLPYPYITNFVQEAIYDEVGETDWIYTKFNVTVQSILNTDYNSQIFVNGLPSEDIDTGEKIQEGSISNSAFIMKYIRNKLLQPRRTLSIKFNDVELIPQSYSVLQDEDGNPIPLQGTVDARNGPKPQSCEVTQLTNTTFMVNFNIVAHYWERQLSNIGEDDSSSPDDPTGNAVLFNRWNESIDIDNANYQTRTRVGKFVIRSDNNLGYIADQLRSQMAVVGVPEGFVRVSANYLVSPDGLGISYTIVDKEVFKFPPKPAFEAQGYYSETMAQYGIMRYAECKLSLRGDNNVFGGTKSQTDLLRIAIDVVTTKLQINGANPVLTPELSTGLITDGGIRVDMYENKVEVYLKCIKMYADSQSISQRKDGIAIWGGVNWNFICATPLSDPFPPFGFAAPQPSYQDRGNALNGRVLRAAAYYDPSLQNSYLDRNLGQVVNSTGKQGTDIGAAGIFPEEVVF